MEKFITLNDNNLTKVYFTPPNKCPMCKNNISPVVAADYHNRDLKIVSFLFSCPACGKCFVSHYYINHDETQNYHNASYKKLSLQGSYPNKPVKITFDPQIEKLSLSFCEIYNQAHSAEEYELNQISGIGYRKALEFLIKDYCIYRNTDKQEEIKSKILGQVINDYIDSDKIKNLAKASAWIGNDETHYIRKFQDKDIEDLKRFITATVAFITYDIISDEASDLISGS